MTTDQDDKRVSDAYRELAAEGSPAALDERILRTAARAARSRYGSARAWIRPAAWAATIALSLAVVLEMTWMADAPPTVDALPPALSEERARRDAEVMEIKREDAERQRIAGQADVPASIHPSAVEANVPESTLPSAVEAAAPPGPAAAPETMPPAATGDEVPLRRAEQRARMQADAASADFAAAMEAGSAGEQHCDHAARAAAESWYACILELRRQDLADAADAEFESLLTAFPDFREPPPE